MPKFVSMLFISCLLFSCQSIERYNALLMREIPVTQLQEDVDFAYQKLQRKHPDLYWFTPKTELEYQLDSFKKAIQQPMKPFDFYYEFSQIIGNIGQAHTSLVAPSPKIEKARQKELLKTMGPFSQLKFHFTPNYLLLIGNSSVNKSLPIGGKITHVNHQPVSEIYQKYAKIEFSDGYNKTFVANQLSRQFSYFFTLEHGIQDSIVLQFETADSVFTKTVFRKKIEEKTKAKELKKDSVAKPKLTKIERKQNRIKNRNFGYDEQSKTYTIELSFPAQDSTTAVLKVRNFTKGVPAKAFAEVFRTIAEHDVKHLVLDLRNNGGGYAHSARELFAYLYQPAIAFTQPAKVVSKTSLALAYPQSKTWAGKIIGFPFWMSQSVYSFFKTKKNKEGDYYYKMFSAKPYAVKDYQYQDQLYVLINGGSFSATSLLITMLDQYTQAVFIGEESGGNYDGTVAGIMPAYKLPNSKLDLRIGHLTIKPNYKTEGVKGRGKFPEIEILPTTDDIAKGKDPILQRSLKMIEEANNRTE